MDAQIDERVKRLYVAINRTIETDVTKRPAKVYRSARGVAVMQDFSGGQTTVEQSETLHASIHNVASFHDHLIEWAQRKGIGSSAVHNFFANSNEFCIIRDLWNNDKHGGQPHKDGWSRLAPTISNIRSVCRLQTRAEKGSWVSMTMDAVGRPIVSGDGNGKVMITGEIIDKNGNGVGDAHDILQRAVSVCEAALVHFGVK